MCAVCSLLVEFNPCVQGVTSPQHTGSILILSLQHVNILLSSLPTHPVHFCPKRAIKETNVFPKISWLPALHTNVCQVVTNSECSNYRHYFQSEIAQFPRMRSLWLGKKPNLTGERDNHLYVECGWFCLAMCVSMCPRVCMHVCANKFIFLCVDRPRHDPLFCCCPWQVKKWILSASTAFSTTIIPFHSLAALM